jgi:hypothetical protein
MRAFKLVEGIFNVLPKAQHKIDCDPITLSVIAVSAAAVGGATAYSAAKESSTAKKAAQAQERVAMAQLEAPIKAAQAAADESKAKLKLKQASKSSSILTSPGGINQTDPNTINKPSILGVG